MNWLTPNIRKSKKAIPIIIYRLIIDGSESIKEFIATFNPSLFEMILNGLKILKILTTLKDDKSIEEEDRKNKSTEERQTIRKSKIKYSLQRFLFNISYQ